MKTSNVLSAYNYVVIFGNIEDGKTVRYNNDNTVKVVKINEPMEYTKEGAEKIENIYKSMGCTYVKAIKLVDWYNRF